jgi:hypothetical protein
MDVHVILGCIIRRKGRVRNHIITLLIGSSKAFAASLEPSASAEGVAVIGKFDRAFNTSGYFGMVILHFIIWTGADKDHQSGGSRLAHSAGARAPVSFSFFAGKTEWAKEVGWAE